MKANGLLDAVRWIPVRSRDSSWSQTYERRMRRFNVEVNLAALSALTISIAWIFIALFLFVLSNLSAPAAPTIVSPYESPRETFEGPDRTITWRPWQQSPEGDFRFRIGDRYLGHGEWEHYLGFGQHPASVKALKLSMIRLGNEDVREDVVIRPGLRYGIVKVTNGTMTSHKGVWSWTAQETYLRPRFASLAVSSF